MKLTKRDMHVHTNLSLCASATADPFEYINTAAAEGLEAIGFSNHYWDEDVPGASGWYAQQNTEHVMQLKTALGDVSRFPLKVLFGCETEYAGGRLAITEKKAELFDYVLVPHSHTHMRGFVLPDGCEAPDKHADYLVRSFYAVATHPLAKEHIFGIVHPFCPCGIRKEGITEILRNISDALYYECACAAAGNDIRIELNTSCFAEEDICESALAEYRRFYLQCVKAGCVFFAGSDKHDVVRDREKDIFFKADDIAKALGIE